METINLRCSNQKQGKSLGNLLFYGLMGEILGSALGGNIGIVRRLDEFVLAKEKDDALLEAETFRKNRNMITGAGLGTVVVLYGGYKLYQSYKNSESSQDDVVEAQG
jgi:hypothetical protein